MKRASSSLMRECQVEASSQNDVVLLLSRWRIGDVNVAEGILPAKPFAEFGYGAEIERGAVFARITDVRKGIELLGDDRTLTYLVHEFLTQCDGSKVARKERVFLSRVVG